MSSALSECPWSSYICWPTIDVFYFWTQPLTIPEVFGRTWCPQFVFQKSKHPEHSQLTILRGIHAKSLQSWPSGLFATLWTVAYQAPLSIGFSRQEYWSGLPGPLPGDLPDWVIKPRSRMSSLLAGGFFTTSATWEATGTLCTILQFSYKSKSVLKNKIPWKHHVEEWIELQNKYYLAVI